MLLLYYVLSRSSPRQLYRPLYTYDTDSKFNITTKSLGHKKESVHLVAKVLAGNSWLLHDGPIVYYCN